MSERLRRYALIPGLALAIIEGDNVTIMPELVSRGETVEPKQ